MHLLLAQPGEVSDGSEPVDLDQTPADIIVLSAADTELAALSQAQGEAGEDAPSLRLANLTHLSHPFSVDRYLDETATRSRLVVARILGGAPYWTYGLEQFAQRLREAGVLFAALPGDDKPDDDLWRASSIERAQWEALWAYFVEGGPENARHALGYCRHLLDGGDEPPPARPFLRAGICWPGEGVCDLDTVRGHWTDGAPVVPVVFYRALALAGGLQPVDALVRALAMRGLNALPVFVASLKDPVSAATLEQLFGEAPPSVIVNATSFAVSKPQSDIAGSEREATPLDAPGVPVLQAVLAAGTEEAWASGQRGLSARDIAMNVALPELDGRILARAISFKGEAYFDEATQCPVACYRPQEDRIAFTADLACAWARLAGTDRTERKVAVILANYPNRDGRIANGVGLDTPAGTIEVLNALQGAGYDASGAPGAGADLISELLAGPTNWLTDRREREGGERLSLDIYRQHYDCLPAEVREAIEARWGRPEDDPFVAADGFALSIRTYGNVAVGIQPARGYNIAPKETYHSPDLVPPHNYLAFYFWLREAFGVHAVIHMGKHGNLEWLPGKALALSGACYPEAVLGPVPHLYPFIVNDPGEGTQAKRRAQAVIVDHLTPPMTRAETYGPLKDLETLVDEYYQAAGLDTRRLDYLRREILLLTQTTAIDVDAGFTDDDDEESQLAKLDEYLCDLKESQIRDGLHVFGRAPDGDLAESLIVALVRVARGGGAPKDASLIQALARDLAIMNETFDPLGCVMSASWDGPRPAALAEQSGDDWRVAGDTVERLELLALALVSGAVECAPEWENARAVLDGIEASVRPAVKACGRREIQGVLDALDGRFVAPGPSGAPTRGRLDVLPTGRNFYSVDTRAVPTPAAATLGWKSATLLIERHLQEEGDWPKSMVITAWGTSNMRTGGDDIAQALALMGVRPTWEQASGRVTGFEILPLSVLARPRIDVTLRVSGFFRDAFPAQMDLFDSAARAVMTLDEPATQNPLAERYRRERGELGERRAGFRVFGSRPGAYGAGLQAMIDERLWNSKSDLADAYLEWGGYAYGDGAEGEAERGLLETRLSSIDAVVQNQDNREHDLLDSDDYYQFEGGVAATVEHLKGSAPVIYHNDHSRPERPVVRTLDEEISRVVRARVVNPKWIAGVKRHGYKGAFEIAATVDYLFAFAATTHAVKDHHFDLVHDAVLADDDTRGFIEEVNPAALRDIAERLHEAMERDLWHPKSNSAAALIETYRGGSR